MLDWVVLRSWLASVAQLVQVAPTHHQCPDVAMTAAPSTPLICPPCRAPAPPHPHFAVTAAPSTLLTCPPCRAPAPPVPRCWRCTVTSAPSTRSSPLRTPLSRTTGSQPTCSRQRASARYTGGRGGQRRGWDPGVRECPRARGVCLRVWVGRGAPSSRGICVCVWGGRQRPLQRGWVSVMLKDDVRGVGLGGGGGGFVLLGAGFTGQPGVCVCECHP